MAVNPCSQVQGIAVVDDDRVAFRNLARDLRRGHQLVMRHGYRLRVRESTASWHECIATTTPIYVGGTEIGVPWRPEWSLWTL